MAQVEMRVFNDEMWADSNRGRLKALKEQVKKIVADVHYGIKEAGPGDVTIVVPLLDTELSESDADFEVEVSEGSDNWPSRSKDLGTVSFRGKTPEKIVQGRAVMISKAIIAAGYHDLSHNVFVGTGDGTGWQQYKPEHLGEVSEEEVIVS